MADCRYTRFARNREVQAMLRAALLLGKRRSSKHVSILPQEKDFNRVMRLWGS